MPKRIVLIDDDSNTNTLNKLIIERSNLVDEIIIFHSPVEALDYFNKRSDDKKGSLVLLDINMPIMDGWEFLKYYASQNKNEKVDNVVMLTSSIDRGDQRLAEENEFVSEMVSKPLTLRMINVLVKTYLK
ncbi:response regulator [Ekhidna sp.]|uniref:response regulator n=1 Tax=Ekhidna sp. TaxID=2608089 RepID=UPI00351257AB